MIEIESMSIDELEALDKLIQNTLKKRHNSNSKTETCGTDKYVRIEFADPTIRAVDHFEDIHAAVVSASRNLWARHQIVLYQPVKENGAIVVRLWREKPFDAHVGNQLRGISWYLLRHCDYDYGSHLVGNRLLYYIPVRVF
jgi:hypothetical protein